MTEDYTLSAVLLLGDDDGASTLLCLVCASASPHPSDGFCRRWYFADGETGGTEKYLL